MTARKADIAVSLAGRGRPELWANELETAVLSGMSQDQFAKKIEALEALGFPKRNPFNDKRFIPHIIAFWERVPVADLNDDESEGQPYNAADHEHWENARRNRRKSIREAS